MTRQQFNPIAMILVTVLIVAVKSVYFPYLAGEQRIYYLAVVAIAAVVSGFEVIKFVYAQRQTKAGAIPLAQGRGAKRNHATRRNGNAAFPPPGDSVTDEVELGHRKGKPNHRDAYRLIYPPESRPVLEVSQAPFNHPLGHELVIYDLSERGLGFHHDGLLTLSGTLLGRIRFSDGEYLEVAGDVIHHRHDRVGLALHCYIPHERFMKEQRMLITRHKPNRLNLEVMRRSMGSARVSHPALAGGCPCQRPKS